MSGLKEMISYVTICRSCALRVDFEVDSSSDSCSDLNMVSPPTPPLTESDVQRLPKAQIAHSSASTSLIDATSTFYQDMFPTISSLAIQICHLELIDLAETTELTVRYSQPSEYGMLKRMHLGGSKKPRRPVQITAGGSFGIIVHLHK